MKNLLLTMMMAATMLVGCDAPGEGLEVETDAEGLCIEKIHKEIHIAAPYSTMELRIFLNHDDLTVRCETRHLWLGEKKLIQFSEFVGVELWDGSPYRTIRTQIQLEELNDREFKLSFEVPLGEFEIWAKHRVKNVRYRSFYVHSGQYTYSYLGTLNESESNKLIEIYEDVMEDWSFAHRKDVVFCED